MSPTVYIETTIVSYLTARPSRDLIRRAHQRATKDWWDEDRKAYKLVTSQLTFAEAAAGDLMAAEHRLAVLEPLPLLEISPAALALANALESVLKLPQRSKPDALHVAIAATSGTHFLLTWNCKHLANGNLLGKIEVTCARLGVTAPRVLTPLQLRELP